jgi:hypothetical protein
VEAGAVRLYIHAHRSHPGSLYYARAPIGSMLTWWTHEAAEAALETEIPDDRRDDYQVEPVDVYTCTDKPQVYLVAPGTVRVQVETED